MKGNPLAGQVALITGAAKRIGRSIALRLAADGADVVVNYSSSKAEAESLVGEIASAGRRAVAIRADVTRRAEVVQLFAEAESKFGRLDILVNNVGTFFSAKFEDSDRRAVGPRYERQLEVAVPMRASGRPLDETPGPRSHCQLIFAGRIARVALLYSLLRFQSGGNHADALPRALSRSRDSSEQHCTRDNSISR